MLLGLKWHWWLIIVVVVTASIPFKINFMKWWSKRQEGQKNCQKTDGAMRNDSG